MSLDDISEVKGVGPVMSKYLRSMNIMTRGDLAKTISVSTEIERLMHGQNSTIKSGITKIIKASRSADDASELDVKAAVKIIDQYMNLDHESIVTKEQKFKFKQALLTKLAMTASRYDTSESRRDARLKLRKMQSVYFVHDSDKLPHMTDISKRAVIKDDTTLIDVSVYNKWHRECKYFRDACTLARQTCADKYTKLIIYMCIIKYASDYFVYIGKSKNGIIDRWRRGHVEGAVDALSNPLDPKYKHQLVDTMVACVDPSNVMIFVINVSQTEFDMEAAESKYIDQFKCFRGKGAFRGLNMVGGKIKK